MSKVIYGVAGIRQRNYRVWINFEDMASVGGELDFITAVDDMGEAYIDMIDSPAEYELAKAHLDVLKTHMYHVGEMRADSIDVSIEDGDSVEGNEVGKIVMGKDGKFSCELINSTPDILTWLGQRDTKECIIMLEEINSKRLKSYDGALLETHEIIFIGNVPAMAAGLTDGVGGAFNYSEKIMGNNIAISTINVERSVAGAGDFRKIIDFRYEVPSTAPILESPMPMVGNFDIDIIWSWERGEGTPAVDGYRVEMSTSATFANGAEMIENISDVLTKQCNMTMPDYGTYYFRMCGTIQGIQKTVYSAIEDAVLAEE